MTASSSGRFRTKTGHVDVSPESLHIARTGLRGRTAQVLQGRSGTLRTWLLYGGLIAALLWLGWASLKVDSVPLAAVSWSMAAWMAWTLVSVRNFSMAPVVSRQAATRIEAVRGWPGMTRDRLIVHFDEDGRPARRFILMPGVLQNGRGEIDRAIATLQAQDWPVEAP
ncbi:MAG: hypothetical protein AAGA48_19800 [Myxococcota bacterium]